METLNGFFGFWNGITLSLPFNYVLLVLGVMALSTIWGKHKQGLLVVAGAFMYWVFDANRQSIMEMVNGSSIGMMAALSIVLTMSVLVAMAFQDER